MLEYMATAYGIVAVGMIAPVSSVLSKILKTTLKKRFLDIARSADIARKGMTGR
jgi:Flp pilus assembly pilin Flp